MNFETKTRLETRNRIASSSTSVECSAVMVDVFLDGEVVNTFQIASGPKDDVEEFFHGLITLAQLRKRW